LEAFCTDGADNAFWNRLFEIHGGVLTLASHQWCGRWPEAVVLCVPNEDVRIVPEEALPVAHLSTASLDGMVRCEEGGRSCKMAWPQLFDTV
jgi:hypothetical protein